MGCGGSRMGGAEGDEVPPRIRPLLRRRLEEMKKRSQASVLKGKQTLSKKELLHQGSDGEETEHDGSMRSAKVAPAPADLKEVVDEEEEKKVVIEVVKEREHNDDDDDDHDHHDDGNGHDHDDHHVEEEDEEEEGRMSNFDGPGSPSFRVYCIDVSDDDNESEDKDGEEKKKPQLENATIPVDPKESVKRGKKERKGRRFGIVLPKTTPRKYLFNVTAPCYAAVGGGGCMGNHHSRLVQEKSTK